MTWIDVEPKPLTPDEAFLLVKDYREGRITQHELIHLLVDAIVALQPKGQDRDLPDL